METNFPLLSDELRRINESAEHSDNMALRRWLNMNLNVVDLESGGVNEEELLKTVGEMLKDTDNFAIIPEAVRKLTEIYESLVSRKEEYLLFALSEQKKRLESCLNHTEKDLVNKLNDIKRSLSRAEAKLAEAKHEQSSGELDDRKERLADKILRKNSILIPILLLLNESIELENLGFDQRVTGRIRKIKADIIAALNDIDQKYEAKLKKCEESVSDLKVQVALLENQLALRGKMSALLEKTTARLTDLLPEKSESEPAKAEIETGEDDVSDQTVLKKDAPRREQEGMKNQVAHRKSNPGLVQARVEPVVDQQETENVMADTDISKIKEAMMRAREGRNKIRILVPDKMAHRFESDWKKLLKTLGFEGKMELVECGKLNNSSDTESPVLVTRKLNGLSKNLVKGNFKVIDLSPSLLLNHIQSSN